jgi:xanthine dehydrogenase YagR molybdenum-binding subunit
MPVDQVVLQIGDTDLPPTDLAAGSSHASGIVHAVALACQQIRERVAQGTAASNGPLAGRDPA